MMVISVIGVTMSKKKIVISGLVWPLSMMHYFWKAFLRRDDVDLIVAGPFMGSNIPWNNGMRLPEKYVMVPDIELPESFSRVSSCAPDVIEGQLPWKPDLWLQIDAGWHLSDRPYADVVALIETDPHVLSPHYKDVKRDVDIVFCMQTPYMKPGEIYLPYAFDPILHRHMDVEKKYDACLIGLHYSQRDALVNALRKKDYTIYYSIGEIYGEYTKKYNESNVALSWSSLLDLPARVWEAFGIGIPLLTNRVPDLDNFFVEGEHYLGFDTLDEAVNQFKLLMSDEPLRNYLSGNAHRIVKTMHTWDARVNQIMNEVWKNG